MSQCDALKVLVLIYIVFILGGTSLAYSRNARLSNDDSRKQDYRPIYIPLSLLVPPFLAGFFVGMFILWSLLFGAFLVSFPIALLLFRQVTILRRLVEWWIRVGHRLLQITRSVLRPVYALLGYFFSTEPSA